MYYGYGLGMPYYGYGMDPTILLVVIGAILSMLASARVRSTYAKYSRVRSLSGMTGAQAAEVILRRAGIFDVQIQHVRGSLTDHYNPANKTLHLSDAVYGSTSVAAVGVAAHECGHAMQHQEGYFPLQLRSALVPAANLGSHLGFPMILVGLLLARFSFLVTLGIWAFSLSVLFQLVTLPVEFNASSRALRMLAQERILEPEELSHTRSVLGAAAMTYVAAAAASILTLLRLVLLFGGNRRRN